MQYPAGLPAEQNTECPVNTAATEGSEYTHNTDDADNTDNTDQY
jgi:hypothetical protein